MTSFETVLDQFARKRVFVVGDIMLDRFVYGHVSRISPEAPAPVEVMLGSLFAYCPYPEERALARVSIDGNGDGRASRHPSRRPPKRAASSG